MDRGAAKTLRKLARHLRRAASILLRMARSVIAATGAIRPISAASSSIHSWPIMVYSMSASSSLCALAPFA